MANVKCVDFCPTCGSDTKILSSRNKGGVRVRRRVCTNGDCKFRFNSLEITEHDYIDFLARA